MTSQRFTAPAFHPTTGNSGGAESKMQFNKLVQQLTNLLLALTLMLFALALIEGRVGSFTLTTPDLFIHLVAPCNTSPGTASLGHSAPLRKSRHNARRKPPIGKGCAVE